MPSQPPSRPPRPLSSKDFGLEIDLELSGPDDPPLVVPPGTPDLRTPEGRAEYDRRQALLRPTPPKPLEIDLELMSPGEFPPIPPGALDLRTPEGRAEYDRRQADASRLDGHQS